MHGLASDGRAASSADAPGFCMIAIAQSTAAVDHVIALARSLPSRTLALMLRDPDHRRAAVVALARHLLSSHAPPNILPIAGAYRVPGIAWTHLTSEGLVAANAGLGDAPFGASAHTIEQGLAAVGLGARYVTFSPIFPTASKAGHPGVGLGALRAFCAEVPLPVFALGGIGPASVASCIDAGARGIASISLFAPGSKLDIAALAEAIDERRRGDIPSSFPENQQR